jgi:tetratricopeptide (TPR) repeat protein
MNKFCFPGYAGLRAEASLFLIVTFLSGCAHTNILSQGDTYAEQGRYELAMVQYDKALQLKPDRDDTRDKFKQAQMSFQHWLQTINDAADVAYDRNQKGRALVLYGKVLASQSSEENHQAETRFQALHSALSNQSLLKVKVSYPLPAFGHNIETDIADIIPILDDYTGLPNQREYSFALEEFGEKIVEQDEEFVGEYISGAQLVGNPEIDHLQNRIHHIHREMKELRRDRKKYKHRIKDAGRTIARIEEEQDDNPELDTEQESKELKQAKAQLHRARRKLHKINDELEDQEDRLYNTIHQLAGTPATIIVDVYSPHSYFVTHSAYILKGEVLVTTAGRTVAYPLEVVDNDSYHDAQPLLDLNADPLVQISAKALSAELHASARIVAQNFIRDEVQEYRAGLLTSAEGAIGINSRFEKLVSYGLSGRNGVSQRVANQMEEELQADYGVQGEFPVNKLLYGF